MDISDDLVGAIAKTFITRRDVFAHQDVNGWYPTDRPLKKPELLSHLQGQASYGHYLLGTDSKCKFFAFDIDLNKNGPEFTGKYPGEWGSDPFSESFDGYTETAFDPRAAWRDRSHPSRSFQKLQLKSMASLLADQIMKLLEIPVVVTYSGYKGLHVYGLTGLDDAVAVREGAQIVIDSLDFVPLRGKAFYRHADTHLVTGYHNLTVEVFPKQTSLSEGGFGNLMALPLGKNIKGEARFFTDFTTPAAVLQPCDALTAITTGNPFINAHPSTRVA